MHATAGSTSAALLLPPTLAPPAWLRLQAGASGRYLDAEKLTRDPLELSVGQRTAAADGGPLSLPEARPLASRALAIATLVAGCGSLSGLLPPLLMSSTEVALGAHWQLLTASLQPLGWANLAATVAALATAGAYAERRMGSTRFAATYLAGGAMTSLAYYAASAVLEEGTGMAGAAAALLGPAAALAVFAAANWRVLGAAQRGHCALAAAGLAAVALTELELLAPVYAVSAVAGAALGAAAGPQLQILRELDIKEGSMTISGNEDELVVVVDRRTAPQRLLVCGAAGLLLAGATWLADGAVSLALEDDFLNVLLSNWSDPEVQLELFNRAPESWDLRA